MPPEPPLTPQEQIIDLQGQVGALGAIVGALLFELRASGVLGERASREVCAVASDGVSWFPSPIQAAADRTLSSVQFASGVEPLPADLRETLRNRRDLNG